MLMTNVTLLEVRRWSPTTACVSWGRTQLCVSCWQARLQISPPRRTSLGCRTSLHSSSTPILPGKGWGHQAAVNPLVSRFPNLLYSYQPVSVVFQIVRVIVQQLYDFSLFFLPLQLIHILSQRYLEPWTRIQTVFWNMYPLLIKCWNWTGK